MSAMADGKGRTMESNYKLVASDIDGTLLNSKKELTSNNKSIIEEAIRNNIIFAISTGRPYITTRIISDLFDYDLPLILYNGACVMTSKSRKLIYQQNLTRQQALSIIKIINENNGTYSFWKNECFYVNRIDSYISKYIKDTVIKPIMINRDTDMDDITKVIWFDENVNLRLFQRTLLQDLKEVNFFTTLPTYLEFVSKGISKATALEMLGKFYHIRREEMMAIGDGQNDIPMITYAGLGVAVENAEEELKEKADFITLSNDNDGVAYAIKKFILGEKEK
jgi:Cof subfamily protein (haloacid dehalogenase superfamily)